MKTDTQDVWDWNIAQAQGFNAAFDGKEDTANPYAKDFYSQSKFLAWYMGWVEGKQEGAKK